MNQPSFSIVVATYNRPREIARCLAGVAALDYPADRFEVVVVDDGSREPLDAVVEPFRSRLDLTLLRQPNSGPASARNAGARQAKYDFCAFTDDDCVPQRDWLRELANVLTGSPDAAVGGSASNDLPGNIYSTASQCLISFLYGYYNRDPQRATFFASNNFSVAKPLFLAAGGFDVRYPNAAAEDRAFCDAWRAGGGTMIYAPAAVIGHAHRLTLGKFWTQHFNYGRGAWRFHSQRATRYAQPLRVEKLDFYISLLAYPFRARTPRAMRLAALLWISQAANAGGFFWEKWQPAAPPIAPTC